jgi:hypothetical protein
MHATRMKQPSIITEALAARDLPPHSQRQPSPASASLGPLPKLPCQLGQRRRPARQLTVSHARALLPGAARRALLQLSRGCGSARRRGIGELRSCAAAVVCGSARGARLRTAKLCGGGGRGCRRHGPASRRRGETGSTYCEIPLPGIGKVGKVAARARAQG